MARLSAQKRQQLKRRASKEAARENAGSGAVARATINQANKDYGREARDARGAQRTETSQLSSMLSSIQGSGLKGRYAAQTANELRARKMDAISGLPYQIQKAGEARTDVVSAARADLAASRVAQQDSAGTKFNDLLKEARTNKQDRIDERRDKIQDRRDEKAENSGRSTGVKNALIIAGVAWDNSDADTRSMFMQSPKLFAAGVAKKAEGADAVDALKAVEILMKKYRRKTLKKTLDPFVTFKNEK